MHGRGSTIWAHIRCDSSNSSSRLSAWERPCHLATGRGRLLGWCAHQTEGAGTGGDTPREGCPAMCRSCPLGEERPREGGSWVDVTQDSSRSRGRATRALRSLLTRPKPRFPGTWGAECPVSHTKLHGSPRSAADKLGQRGATIQTWMPE